VFDGHGQDKKPKRITQTIPCHLKFEIFTVLPENKTMQLRHLVHPGSEQKISRSQDTLEDGLVTSGRAHILKQTAQTFHLCYSNVKKMNKIKN
jgi:hypothetical protein